MTRHVKLYLLLVAAMMLGFVLVVLLWANDDVELGEGRFVDPVGKLAGEVERDELPAVRPTAGVPDEGYPDYVMGQKLDPPKLCLDNRAVGFDVAAAAAEFDGLVPVTVGGCDAADNVAIVRTVQRPGEHWSGWYNSPSAERDGAALISLNVAEAYRMTPHGWHMALTHEIGHAVGLDHTQGVSAAMDPIHYAEESGLTPADRQQLVALYGPDA